MPVNAMLAELDQDIATRHALGGHGVGSTVWVPRCEFHGVSSTARFTSGQLGKPNNDTRLPPRTVVPTNKACPEARLFPVTLDSFFCQEVPFGRHLPFKAFETAKYNHLNRSERPGWASLG